MLKTLAMTDKEFQKFISTQTKIDQEFIDQSFKFWIESNQHIRSPFPKAITEELKEKTYRVFMEWVYELKPDEVEKMKEEDFVEMFENIMFNQAIQLIDKNDIDSMITINYPFLPRLGDCVDDEKYGSSRIVRREIQKKEDDKVYMTLSMKNQCQETWESKFVLPA